MLFIAAILLYSCEKDDDTGENCIDNNPEFLPAPIPEEGIHSLHFYSNSEIKTIEESGFTFSHITSGSKTVFKYQYSIDPEEWIADDEYAEEILFEIEPGIDAFLISGSDLKRSTALFGQYCFCTWAGNIPITTGCIKGEKINDEEWKIDINISSEKDDQMIVKMLSEIFVKNTL